MITYRPKAIEVFLDGKKVGEIRQEFPTTRELEILGKNRAGDVGWRYFPSDFNDHRGKWFDSIEDCKRSLEK